MNAENKTGDYTSITSALDRTALAKNKQKKQDRQSFC
ncbi:MAG: hypothetical protein ACJAT7_000579 [Psychromonas sp.]|jgi:hypothetical protein